MSVRSDLVAALEATGYPVYLQGTLNPDAAYPDSFWTYWCFDAPETMHYDNSPHSCDWGFWVYFYSNDPELVDTVPQKAKRQLKNAGWTFDGMPTDAESGRSSHTGSMLTCYFKEVIPNG